MRFLILIISALVSMSLHSQNNLTTNVGNDLSLDSRTEVTNHTGMTQATSIGFNLFDKPNKGSLDYLYDSDIKLAGKKPNLLSQSILPDPKAARTSNRFLDLNFGLAFTDLILDNDNSRFIFPGVSFLWGNTITYANNTVLEYEAGIALPSIVTGKIGIGKKFENSTFIVGVRPYPANLYVQFSFAHRDRGYWTVSLEYNPLRDSDNLISLGSRTLLTFGYRWHRPRRHK